MDIRKMTWNINNTRIGNGVKKTLQQQHPKKTNKWSDINDSVFNLLADHVNNDEKIKIADFLNMFYYFIICYSKTCYKKGCNWNKKYTESTHYITNKPIINGNTFDHDRANELQAHTLILDMQKALNIYRNEFLINKQNYLNEIKIKSIMIFIDESLYTLANIIAEPVKVLSTDIRCKINIYKIKKTPIIPKKSANINYEALEKILNS